MADLWYPDGVYDPAPATTWSSFTGGAPKFLLHTTEGRLGAYTPDGTVGAGRTYFGRAGIWPNYTLAIQSRSNAWRVFNHIPANYGAMGLVNAAGGVETNRENVNQIEIATTAANIGSLPDAALAELAKLLAWQHATRGVPVTSSVRWVGAAGYGLAAPQRLSPSAWVGYAGVLGHEHCPENEHWDPGAFPIDELLSRTDAILSGDDVTEQDKVDIANKVLAALRDQVFSVQPTIRQGNAGQVVGATYNKVGDLQAAISGLPASVSAASVDAVWEQVTHAGTAATSVASLGALLAATHESSGAARDRLDFLYDQLAKIAQASRVALDPPPWRS
jgi:hypothetical protein